MVQRPAKRQQRLSALEELLEVNRPEPGGKGIAQRLDEIEARLDDLESQ